MPDSYGKRKRRDVKARKAAAREERRLARNRRRSQRAAGAVVLPPGVEEEAGLVEGAEEAGAVGDGQSRTSPDEAPSG